MGAALLLVAGVQAFAPAASAASVEPTLVDGNAKCSGASKKNAPSLGYDHGAKIEGVPDDGVDQDLGDLTVTIENAGDFSFDFKDATPDVLAVIVKASDSSNVYEYGGPTDSDTNIQSVLKDDGSGDRHQISHVEFCWNDPDDGENPSSTVAKLWFDSDEEIDDPPADSDIVVTVTPDEDDPFTLDHDALTAGDGIVDLDHDAEDVAVDETTVPEGWDEFTCPEEYTDEADFVFCNKREVTTQDTDITVKKVWFDTDGDETDAPADSDIVITVDVTDGTDEVLEHDDLDDGVVTVTVAPTNVSGVDETTVPDGWDEITCAEGYADDADYVFCNRRESSGGGGGGGRNRGSSPTTTTLPTEVLPFTAEPEPEAAPQVVPEVLPETITTAAPQLPFTGTSSSIRLAAVAAALLALGGTLIVGGRRRPEMTD